MERLAVTEGFVPLNPNSRARLRAHYTQLVAEDAAETRARAEALAAAAAAEAALTPGTPVTGEGIFLGRYTLPGQNGGLARTFNIFAAPEDLDNKIKEMNYDKLADYFVGMTGWHGHDGQGYHNDDALKADLASGRYGGEWVVPPIEVLCGFNDAGQKVQAENLFDCKEEGAFKDTFNTFCRAAGDFAFFYWSSTEERNSEKHVRTASFANKERPMQSYPRGGAFYNCRPVRFVPAAGGTP